MKKSEILLKHKFIYSTLIQFLILVSCAPNNNLSGSSGVVRDSISITYKKYAYRDDRGGYFVDSTNTKYSNKNVSKNINKIKIGDAWFEASQILGTELATADFHKKNVLIGRKSLKICLYSEPVSRSKSDRGCHLIGVVFVDNRVDKVICCNYGISNSNMDTIHDIKKYCYDD